MQTRGAKLSAAVVSRLAEGDLAESIAAQHDLVALLEASVGKQHWQTRSELSLKEELDRVAKRSQQDQDTYFVGHRLLVHGGQQMAIEDYDGASASLGKAEVTFATVPGQDCVSMAATLEKLGGIHLVKEEPAIAKEYLVRAMATWTSVVGDDHPALAGVLDSLGVAHLESGNLDDAETCFRTALDLERSHFGVRTIRYAHGLANLSRVMLQRGKSLEAEALCVQAIVIAREIRQQDSPQMASILFIVAEVNIAHEEYENAEVNLQNSLALYERRLPRWSPIIAKVLERYSWLSRKLDQPEDADSMEARAKAIREQIRAASARNENLLK
jgi:tetratricopeptide (TPR) repeat protein